MEIDFLSKLHSKAWVAILFVFASCICTGVLFVFIYYHTLFINLDTIKLILLGCGITFPIWLFNCFNFLMFFGDKLTKTKEGTDFLLVGIYSAILTTPLYYILFLIQFFTHAGVILFVIIIGSIEIFITIVSQILNDKRNKINKEKGNPQENMGT